MNLMKTGFVCLIASLAAPVVNAADWMVDSGASAVSFGSIKKGSAGEAHEFTSVSGEASQDGAVSLSISLRSVETNIAIRNKRMIEHVFQKEPSATVTGQVDMGAIEALGVGEMMPLDIEANLKFLGKDIPFEASVIAVRLGESRAMVMSDGLTYLSTEDLGIDAGVDKLMELAKLPSIARAVPVTLRLVFDHKH